MTNEKIKKALELQHDIEYFEKLINQVKDVHPKHRGWMLAKIYFISTRSNAASQEIEVNADLAAPLLDERLATYEARLSELQKEFDEL